MLTSTRGISVVKFDAGIYYLIGDVFPIQLVVTSRLSKENNFWIRNLTNDLKSGEEADTLFRKYNPKQDNILYKSIMNNIIRANNELFRREKTMCEALRELMQEEMDELRQQSIAEGLAEGRAEGRAEGKLEEKRNLIAKKLSKGKSLEEIADALEESVENIKELISAMQIN